MLNHTGIIEPYLDQKLLVGVFGSLADCKVSLER